MHVGFPVCPRSAAHYWRARPWELSPSMSVTPAAQQKRRLLSLNFSLFAGILPPRRVAATLRTPPYTRRFRDPVSEPAFLCATCGDVRDRDRTSCFRAACLRNRSLSLPPGRCFRFPFRPAASPTGLETSHTTMPADGQCASLGRDARRPPFMARQQCRNQRSGCDHRCRNRQASRQA